MTRRFYPRPQAQPSNPSTRRKPTSAYSLWFIPVLILVGGSLGMAVYWMMSAPATPVQTDVAQPSARKALPEQVAPIVQEAAALSGLDIGGDVDDAPAEAEPDVARTFEGLRIQVLNGCGVKGLARIITPALRSHGFDVRETRNAGNFDYQESRIIDRTGDIGRARMVADSLGIDTDQVVTESAEGLVDIDLTLIVGADYQRLNINTKVNRE